MKSHFERPDITSELPDSSGPFLYNAFREDPILRAKKAGIFSIYFVVASLLSVRNSKNVPVPISKPQPRVNWFNRQREPQLPIATSARPGEFDLGSLESRAAARLLAGKKTRSGFKISVCLIAKCRPDDEKPQPAKRWPNGDGIEHFYCDDTDWPRDKK